MGPIRTTHRLAWVALAMAVAACDRRDRSAPAVDAEAVWAAFRESDMHAAIRIRYPLDETVFPPEIVAPTVRWEDPSPDADAWVISVGWGQAGSTSGQGLRSGSTDPSSPALAALSSDADEGEGGRKRGQGELSGSQRLRFAVREQIWRPEERVWEAIKERSAGRMATVWILGVRAGSPARVVSAGRVRWETSRDAVGAAIFYREVNLPFIEAVKDPSRIRWRWGEVSSAGPPVVLEGLPVCGNCHSFTRDGQWLAMDVDYANSKGSYVITRTAEEMVLATSEIITWNDYRPEDNEQTFGLLSQISPDGRAVISTVKDKSVFVPRDGLAYSQLFFPIKGILAWYDRASGRFESLPGADDPAYVQSNPVWSPDGRHIVFARAPAYDLRHTLGQGKVLLSPEECREFLEEGKPFLFDLYRIPFNEGRGGKAEPLAGASGNDRSNFFPRYSPDGRWILFCQSKSYMLLQPDSELYLMPAEGGQPRRLRANTGQMNSWHSWSPSGRWIVFSSKANGPYTQLWLSHVDEAGESSPPVCLERFTQPDRAANIPEFVNLRASAIRRIRESFLNDYSFLRAGNEFYKQGDHEPAIQQYRKAIELNPRSSTARQKLGFLLFNVRGERAEGMEHLEAAVKLDARNGLARYDLGMALALLGRHAEAIPHLRAAIELLPAGAEAPYQAPVMRYQLGRSLFLDGDRDGGIASLEEAIRLDPDYGTAHYLLATVLAYQGFVEEPLVHYHRAVTREPGLDRTPELHERLAMNLARAGRFAEAVAEATRAIELARATGRADVEARVAGRLSAYRQGRE